VGGREVQPFFAGAAYLAAKQRPKPGGAGGDEDPPPQAHVDAIAAAYARAATHGMGPAEWWVHRVAISEQYRCPPRDVRAWACRDLLEAHVVLDMIDEMRPLQEREAERKAKNASAQ
jgi:hypothetical protein